LVVHNNLQKARYVLMLFFGRTLTYFPRILKAARAACYCP
jgi:hypothetical protein